MKLPNKVIPYNESIISKFPLVLNILKNGDCSVSTLYEQVQRNIGSINEFLDVLDCLFALGKIILIEENRRLHYAS